MAYFFAARDRRSLPNRAITTLLSCICGVTVAVAAVAAPLATGPVSAAPVVRQQDQSGETTPTLAENQTTESATVDQPTTSASTASTETSPTEAPSDNNSSTAPTEGSQAATTDVPVEQAPETTPPETTLPETTVPDNSTDTTGVDPTSTEPTVDEPSVTGPDGSVIDDSSTTIDPLTGEAPNDEVPDGSITVPDPDRTYNQAGYKPAEVLWSSVAAAEQKLADVELKRVESIRQIRTLRVRLKELGYSREQLDAESTATLEELLEATDRVKGRAMHDYRMHSKNGRTNEALFSASPGDDGGVDFDAILAGQRELKLNELVISVGSEQLGELADLKGSLDSESFEVFERLRVTTESLAIAEEEMFVHDQAAEQAKIEYEAFSIGSEVFIEGVVFPIARPYSLPLIDSFGFPRMPGTADEHWHEGIDIFAPKGTPLLATERGVIARLGSGRLGGLKFWLVGESGSEWYYAHLDSFAPGLTNGMVVEAGDLVGYVGNTGNARTTPPHLHMELHPGGGRPVNPYPILKVISDVEILGIENGTFTDSPYQPYVQPGSELEPEVDPGTETTIADGEDTTTSESTTTQLESTTTVVEPSTTTPPVDPSTTSAPPQTEPTDNQVTTTDAVGEPTTEQPASTETPPESAPTAPTCSSSESDPDGDGWGFENNESCIVP